MQCIMYIHEYVTTAIHKLTELGRSHRVKAA